MVLSRWRHLVVILLRSSTRDAVRALWYRLLTTSLRCRLGGLRLWLPYLFDTFLRAGISILEYVLLL